MRPYKVYVLTDPQGRLIDINSDAFLSSVDGWQQIDEGSGDKYRHAQGNYLPMPLMDERGVSRWKLEGGQVALRSAEEIAADIVDAAPEVGNTDADAVRQIAELERQIAAQDQQIAMLLEGVTEDE